MNRQITNLSNIEDPECENLTFHHPVKKQTILQLSHEETHTPHNYLCSLLKGRLKTWGKKGNTFVTRQF